MEKYSEYVLDAAGNVILGATVRITDKASGSNATIFSDNIRTSKANPFTAESDGEITYYADNGRFDVVLTGTVTKTISDVQLYDFTDAALISISNLLDKVINNDAALQDVDLVVPVTVGNVYAINAFILISTVNTAADFAIRFDSPNAGDVGEFNLTATDANGVVILQTAAVENTDISGLITTTDAHIAIEVHGFVDVDAGGSAGDFSIQLAQDTAHASDLTVARGSWMQVQRINT